MQREFVIVYKAKPDENDSNAFLFSLDVFRACCTRDIERAKIYYSIEDAQEVLSFDIYQTLDKKHEPGVVMEKITTISLKLVD